MEKTTKQTLQSVYEQISNATANLLSIYDRIAYGDGLANNYVLLEEINNVIMGELKIRELIKTVGA